jgi:hypothetical protein
MITNTQLPLTVDEITPEWLSEALDTRVSSVTESSTIRGTGTKVFVDVTFEDDASPLPTSLCVKGGFGEEVRSFGTAEAYIVEARFYGSIAPGLDLRLPRCHYAAVDVERGQGIVILDDLREQGATFGEPTEPWSADRVAAALEQQARWHGGTWGGAQLRDAGLSVGSSAVRVAAPMLFSAEHWAAQASIAEIPSLEGVLADREAMRAAFHRLWQLDDAGDLCLAHGDAHVGNTFIDSSGNPGFLDWQCPCLGPWSYDVAYFLVGALPVDVRRSVEKDLLREYLAALAAAGGPRIGYDDAWLAYRRSSLHGFFWAITPPVMQPVERVAAMAERHLAAIEDLETLAALNAGRHR